MRLYNVNADDINKRRVQIRLQSAPLLFASGIKSRKKVYPMMPQMGTGRLKKIE
jgi:hypothetical protein